MVLGMQEGTISAAYNEAKAAKGTAESNYVYFDHDRKNEYGHMSEKSTGLSKSNFVEPGNLVPLLSLFGCTGLCSDIVYLNAHPSEWGLGGTCNPCCFTCPSYWLWTCQFLKQSDIQGECCILWDFSIREVLPRAGCDCALDALFVGAKCLSPKESDYETAAVPCLLNIGGCNICLDGNFRFGFMQSVKTLKEGQWCCFFLPCVLGSLNNCQIICDCYSAMKELWQVKVQGNKTTPKESSVCNDDNHVDSATEAEPEKLKAEVMLREGVDLAAAEAMKQITGFGNKGKDQAGKTRVDDLYPCLGVLCFVYSCFCKFPDYLGGYQECGIIGLNASCTCCKPLLQRGQVFTGDIFLCLQWRQGLACPRTCLNCIHQCGCEDCRCAIPCDGRDVPCIINVCFLNLCYNWRPTFHCTWYAPLAQFKEDYQGEKYTVIDMLCISVKFCCRLFEGCKKPENGPKSV